MWIFSSFRKELSLGERVPRCYGMAWYEPRRNVGVYFPVPFHSVVRLCRNLRRLVSAAFGSHESEHAIAVEFQRLERERQRLADEFARGYLKGWRECFQTCLSAIEDEISQNTEVWEAGTWLAVSSEPVGPQN